MSNRNVMTILDLMKLTDEEVGVVVANDGQGLITIDDFAQLNEKSVEGIYLVVQKPGGTTGEVSNSGVSVSEISKDNLQGMIY